MSQQEVEVILMRQLASYLAMPIFIVDPEGNLIYYNEPAEPILGHRFEETGEMPLAEWSVIFEPTDLEGRPIPSDRLPLVIAVADRKPAYQRFYIRGLDGKLHEIELTAVPLV